MIKITVIFDGITILLLLLLLLFISLVFFYFEIGDNSSYTWAEEMWA